MTRSRPHHERGFSVLELLATVAIAAFVLAVALPQFSLNGQNGAFRAAVSGVANGLKQARAQSIMTSTPQNFVIDPSAGRYGIVPDAHGSELPEGRFPQGMTARVEDGTSSSGARRGPARILFQPDGTAPSTRIELAHQRRTAHIGIHWLTGNISVSFDR